MLKTGLYLIPLLVWWLAACQNNTPSTAQTTNQIQRDTALIEPDASDLLQILQGKWQSEQDSTVQMEIVGQKMKHFNQGNLAMETEIEVDANCLSNACKTDSLETADGWCFVEKGQYDAQCNLILKCDRQELRYRVLGATSPPLVFKRL